MIWGGGTTYADITGHFGGTLGQIMSTLERAGEVLAYHYPRKLLSKAHELQPSMMASMSED